MAITETPLGFQIPTGKELVKRMDDVLRHNGQKAQDLIAADRTRLTGVEGRASQLESRTTAVESVATDAEARITLMEASGRPAGIAPDSQNPGLYLLSPGGQITEDPENPGFFLIGA